MVPPPADYSGALIETEQILEDDDDLMRQLEEIKEAQRTSGEDVQQTRTRAQEEVRCILYPDSPLMPLWNGMLATLVMILAEITVPSSSRSRRLAAAAHAGDRAPRLEQFDEDALLPRLQ